MVDLLTKSDAILSDCGQYRYVLRRSWGDGPDCNFIMLNPSTADATEDDPTIRRCIGFAKMWGYGRLTVTNIFAFRATDPKDMKAANDPVGADNKTYIRIAAENAEICVCAWGAHGSFCGQDAIVLEWLHNIPVAPLALALTKGGQPRHPLYLKSDLTPKIWAGSARPFQR